MEKHTNTLTAAALSLGVDPEDLALVLPQLKSAKAARKDGANRVILSPLISYQTFPNAQETANAARPKVEIGGATYDLTNDFINQMAKNFFGYPREGKSNK